MPRRTPRLERDLRLLVTALAALALLLASAAGVLWWQARDEVDVLLVGDSILRQSGPAIEDHLGGPSVANEAVNGSGLLTPEVHPWLERAPALVADRDPDVVVVLFIGNYTDPPLPTDDAGEPIEFGSPQFFAAWEQATVELLDELDGREVVLVLPPPVLDPDLEPVIDGLRDAYRRAADGRTGVTLVDAFDVLADDDGGYQASAPLPDGSELVLRAGDGVHLSEGGANVLGAHVAATVQERLDAAGAEG